MCLQIVRQQLLDEGELTPFHSITLRLSSFDETQVAPALEKVAAELGSRVAVGSYPVSAQCVAYHGSAPIHVKCVACKAVVWSACYVTAMISAVLLPKSSLTHVHDACTPLHTASGQLCSSPSLPATAILTAIQDRQLLWLFYACTNSHMSVFA